jgi:hypothetical protein
MSSPSPQRKIARETDMFSALDHDPSRHTQLQKIIYDIKHRLRDDTVKVDRPQSNYRWWQEPVGRKSDQSMRLKKLDAENSRLRQAISTLKCDKLFLQEEVRASSSLYRDH